MSSEPPTGPGSCDPVRGPEDSARPVAILVLGMHRSGTSALTRCLNLLGAELGSSLLTPNTDNEAGFWEHRDIVALHDELLAALGTSWSDPGPVAPESLRSDAVRPIRERIRKILQRDFADRRLWGLKDPRLCRLVPLWRSLLEEIGCEGRFVLTCRDAREVAASLERRNGFPPAHSQILWLEHCLAAERDTRGLPRSFLTYDQLLSDWRSHLERVGRELGFDWKGRIASIASDLEAFLDPGLRHHVEAGPEPPGGHPWLRATYEAYRDAAHGEEIAPRLDGIREPMECARDVFLPWIEHLREEEARLHDLVRDRDARVAKLRARAGKAEVGGDAADAPRPLTDAPGTTVTRMYEEREGDPRVSIIIPLFNKAELTAGCLESLAKHTPDGSYEVILVNNGSTDGTADLLGRLEGNVTVVRNEKNLGFATACNQGAEVAGTDLLLFLNNDIEAKEGWLEPLLGVLDADPEVAACGSRLLFPDGTIQHAGVALLHCPVSTVPLRAFHVHYGEPADFPDANVLAEYQVLTGACLLVRRTVFEEVGGFDSYYWNGCEDVDLCLKIGASGRKLVYQPASCLVHHESQSGPERYARVHGNEQLLCSRWLGKAEPDLVEDGNGSRRRTEAGRIRTYLPPAKGKRPEIPSPPVASPDELVSIIVLTRNQLAHTRLCFESIARHTPEPHEILFVDNASTDGTLEYLRDVVRTYPPARVLAKASNLGFAGGNNQGLAAARGRHFVLLNNDTVVTEGWLGGLMSVLDDHPDVGLVGPMTNFASGAQVVKDVPYGTLAEMQIFAQKWAREHAGQSEPAHRLVGFCLLVKRDVVDAIGGLDERFGTGNCEDDDFCLRAHQAGWKARIAREVFIHHTGSRTFAGERIDYARSLATNFEIFKEKWGMDPAARPEDGYPFAALVAGPRQPPIPLPDLSARHMPAMGGRWLQDKGHPAGAGENREAAGAAGAAPGVPPEDAADAGRAAPPPTPAGKVRLRVGVLPGDAPDPALDELFRRYGHTDPIPVWERTDQLAAELQEAGLVLVLGPDVVVTDDALRELVSVAASNPGIAALGPTSNAAPAPQKIRASYRNRKRELHRFAARRRRRHGGKWEEVPHLGGFCLLLRAESVSGCGGLDGSRPLSEALLELFDRLRGDGHRVAVAKGAYVHHSKLTEEEGAGYDAARLAGREAVGAKG